jgi:general secretion pathway protein K
LVLWVIALLTVMALGLTTTQRTESALTQNQLDGARFRALAEAAINLTVLNLMSTPIEAVPAEEVIVPDGMAHRFQFDGDWIEVTVYNESSRIDLNQATGEQLAALIDVVQPDTGNDASARDRVVDAILDWRDADDLTQLNGAEDSDYAKAGMPYGARDDLFKSVEELRQVLGITSDLYERLAPHLSVDNNGGEVDAQFASAVVLAVLQGINLEDAQRIVDERDDPAVPGAQQARMMNRGGPRYRIRVSMPSDAGAPGRTLETLIELGSGATPEFDVRWRRYGVSAVRPAPEP